MSHPNTRRPHWDRIRVISSILVMITHVSGSYLTLFPDYRDHLFYLHLASNALSRAAVPLFVMLTGAIFLSKERFSMMKQLKRVILPLVIWSLIYLAIHHFWLYQAIVWPDSIINLFFREVSPHFWYLYMLIGFYFIMPLLQSFFAHLPQEHHQKLLLLWGFFSLTLPFISSIFQLGATTWQLPLAYSYLGFFLLASYLERYPLAKSLRRDILLLLLVTTAMTLLSAMGFDRTSPWWSRRFIWFGNTYLLVALQAALYWQVITYWPSMPKLDSMITRLSALSFQAYLIHAAIIIVLFRFWRFFRIWSYSGYGLVIFTAITILGSYLFAYLWDYCLKKMSAKFNIRF